MSNIKFEDYSVQVKNVLKDKAIAFLNEVGGEIRSHAQRNSRRKTSQTAGSYQYKVDEGGLAVHIGSDYWNAIYEEFGTGEHSINGGRQGYWVFVDTGGAPQAPKGGKSYTIDEAKKVVAMLRSKGLNAYYTNGKSANRPLFRAFESNRNKIESVARNYFGGT
ncbi:MAG: hypothetical protein Q4F03_04905 [Eubacteriales bacterium]|nr:hypothetical protein [Eubacteriales bacterium]